jgi:hypothetical protein
MVAVAVAVVPWKVCALLPAPVKSSAVPASAFVRFDAILILSSSTLIANTSVASARVPPLCVILVPFEV